MLRFRPESQSTPGSIRGVSRRERLRLWLLVFALGLVLLAMRRIGQPQAEQNLQRWLHLETTTGRKAENGSAQAAPAPNQPIVAPSAENRPPIKHHPPSGQNKRGQNKRGQEQSGPNKGPTRLDRLLREVQDNTSFRPQEQAAWFTLLDRLGQSTPSALQQQSMGTLSYAQLLQQPDVYRGRVVTLHGTVLREEQLPAPTNTVGIHDYHRLILKPAGGGEWPFVVYALKLPTNFPRGESIRARIEVTGFFFKNWSYSWGDGLGLAPVVLSDNVRWIEATPRGNTNGPGNRRQTTDWNLLVLALAAALLFALLVLLVVWRQTRRPRPIVTRQRTGRADSLIHDTLRQLSEQESHE